MEMETQPKSKNSQLELNKLYIIEIASNQFVIKIYEQKRKKDFYKINIYLVEQHIEEFDLEPNAIQILKQLKEIICRLMLCHWNINQQNINFKFIFDNRYPSDHQSIMDEENKSTDEEIDFYIHKYYSYDWEVVETIDYVMNDDLQNLQIDDDKIYVYNSQFNLNSSSFGIEIKNKNDIVSLSQPFHNNMNKMLIMQQVQYLVKHLSNKNKVDRHHKLKAFNRVIEMDSKTITIYKKKQTQNKMIQCNITCSGINKQYESNFYSITKNNPMDIQTEAHMPILNCLDKNKNQFKLSIDDMKLIMDMDQDVNDVILIPHLTEIQIYQMLDDFKKLPESFKVNDVLKFINLVGMDFNSQILDQCQTYLINWITRTSFFQCCSHIQTHFVDSFGSDSIYLYFKELIDENEFDLDFCLLQSYKLTHIIISFWHSPFVYRLFQDLWLALDFLKYDNVPSNERMIELFGQLNMNMNEINFKSMHIDMEESQQYPISLNSGMYHFELILFTKQIANCKFSITDTEDQRRCLIVWNWYVVEQEKKHDYLIFMILGRIDRIDRIELVSNLSTTNFYFDIGMSCGGINDGLYEMYIELVQTKQLFEIVYNKIKDGFFFVVVVLFKEGKGL